MSPKELIAKMLRDLNQLSESVECFCDPTDQYTCENHKRIEPIWRALNSLRFRAREVA